ARGAFPDQFYRRLGILVVESLLHVLGQIPGRDLLRYAVDLTRRPDPHVGCRFAVLDLHPVEGLRDTLEATVHGVNIDDFRLGEYLLDGLADGFGKFVRRTLLLLGLNGQVGRPQHRHDAREYGPSDHVGFLTNGTGLTLSPNEEGSMR